MSYSLSAVIARTRSLRLLAPGTLAVALALVALFGSGWVSTFVFDRLPHVEDDVAFLFQAQTIAGGALLAKAPPEPDFFQIPFTLMRDGHWFGKYPPGYPLVLALGVLAGQPWLLNPVLGAVCIGLIYLLGQRLYGPGTGLVAAALAIGSPFFLLQAGSFMSHIVCLFWALLFALAFDGVVRSSRPATVAVLAGAAMGMLFLSRPLTAVGIGLPYAVFALGNVIADRRWFRLYAAMALGFAPFVAAFLAYNRLTTGDAFRTAYELYWAYDKIGFGDGVGSLGYHGIADAILIAQLNLDLLADYLFGWPAKLSLVPAVLAGVLATARVAWLFGGRLVRGGIASRPETATINTARNDLLLLAVAASLVVVHFAYWTPGQMYGPRYYFEAIGALALLSARGLLELAGLLRIAAGPLRTFGPALLVVAVLALYGYGFATFTYREFGRNTRWYDIDGSGLRAVAAADVRHAVVFVEYDYWTDYAPFFSQNTPTLDSDIVYAIDLGPERNRDLMALYPGRAFFRYTEGNVTPIAP